MVGFGAFGPFVNVGRGGEGTLDVRNGGTFVVAVEARSMRVGRAGDAGEGNGTLSITGGRRVEALFYDLAFDGGVGDVVVSGEGSTLAARGTEGAAAPDTDGDQGAFATIGGDGLAYVKQPPSVSS